MSLGPSAGLGRRHTESWAESGLQLEKPHGPATWRAQRQGSESELRGTLCTPLVQEGQGGGQRKPLQKNGCELGGEGQRGVVEGPRGRGGLHPPVEQDGTPGMCTRVPGDQVKGP